MNSAVTNGVDDAIATIAALIDGEAVVLRREAFMRLVASVGRIRVQRSARRRGAVVFAKACELDLEGIVSERAGSFYKSGKSRNWLKNINPDFVRT